LEILAAWQATADDGEDEPAGTPPAAAPRQASAEEIESWLIERITARLRLGPGDVRVTMPFLELGMGSLDAVEIAAALERWLGRRLSPTAIYNYPTIAALARWLAIPVSPSGGLSVPAAASLLSCPLDDLDAERLLAQVRRMTDQDIEEFLALELAKQQGK
jgi:acyl carrier protein